MMQFFRRMIGSKVGAAIALLFLGLVAFAFAAGDIERRSTGAGLLGGSGDTVATVGSEKLSADDLKSRVQRVFQLNQREQTTLTMDRFLSEGGFKGVLNQLIESLSMVAFGKEGGMRVSKKLIDAEIAQIPAFQNATGAFNQQLFQQTLSREHISEQSLRDDISRQIIEKQLLGPGSGNAMVPMGMIRTYASMLLEKREGRVAFIPAAAFVAGKKPDDAAVKAFFAKSGGRFALPEQRRIRYALIDASRFAAQSAPSDAEIQQYYRANAAQFAASETRTALQLVVPTEAAAKAIAAKVGASGSLDAAAKAAGLAATKLAPMSKTAFADTASPDAAYQLFAAQKGSLVGPVKVGLGWALFRVEAIESTPARSVEAARADIVAKLSQTKMQQALSDLSNKVDGAIGNGATFDEVVKANGLTAAETPALTAGGHDLTQDPKAPADPNLVALAKAAFAMEQDDDPQVVQIVPDQRAAIVAVGQVLASGPPPFDKIKPYVERAYLLDEGKKQAKALADKLHAAAPKASSFDALVASAGMKLPPVQKIGAQRSELGQQGQQIPSGLIALFSMKQGSTRVVELSEAQGYALISLDKITPGNADQQPQVLSETAKGLSGVLTQEYAAQLGRAIQAHAGVTRNQAAIAQVQADLRKSATGGADQ